MYAGNVRWYKLVKTISSQTSTCYNFYVNGAVCLEILPRKIPQLGHVQKCTLEMYAGNVRWYKLVKTISSQTSTSYNFYVNGAVCLEILPRSNGDNDGQ
jgi:ubiquitin-protein ligase